MTPHTPGLLDRKGIVVNTNCDATPATAPIEDQGWGDVDCRPDTRMHDGASDLRRAVRISGNLRAAYY